jgi:hypothetical protein
VTRAWEPAACGPLEAAVARTLFAGVVLWSAPIPEGITGQPDPVGLARLVDLMVLSRPAVAGVLNALGVFRIGALVYMLAVLAGGRTLVNSQGAVGHAHQVVGLVLVAQIAAHLRHARRRARGDAGGAPGAGVDELAFHHSRQAVAALYVAAGVSKLVKSGGTWVLDAPNLAVQIVKTSDQHAYSFPGAAGPGAMDGWAAAVAAHPGLARAVLAAALLLELTAFVALAGRRAAAGVGSGLILMHAGTGFLMRLHFLRNQAVVAIFFLGVPRPAARAARAAAGALQKNMGLPARPEKLGRNRSVS